MEAACCQNSLRESSSSFCRDKDRRTPQVGGWHKLNPSIVIGSGQERRTDLSIQDWRVDEDAGWSTQGKWQVKIIDAGPYDAQVRWKSPIGERQLVLHVGNQSFTGSLAANDATATLPGINLPLGEVDIHVELKSPPLKRDETLRFVTLDRRSVVGQ